MSTINNNICRKNGHKVSNKNATPRAEIMVGGAVVLRPKRPSQTDDIVSTDKHDGHNNLTRLRHDTTKSEHRGAIAYR